MDIACGQALLTSPHFQEIGKLGSVTFEIFANWITGTVESQPAALLPRREFSYTHANKKDKNAIRTKYHSAMTP